MPFSPAPNPALGFLAWCGAAKVASNGEVIDAESSMNRFFAVLSGMPRFLKAWKAPFAMEGSEMLARRKRVYERGTWLVLELDSRPGRVMEQGSPKVICISNHTVSIQQLTILLGFVSKTKSIAPPDCPPSRPP